MVVIEEKLSTQSGKYIQFKIENGIFKIIRGQGGTVTSVDKLNIQSAVKLADKLYDVVGRYEDAVGKKVVDNSSRKPDYKDMSEEELQGNLEDILTELPDSGKFKRLKDAYTGRLTHYQEREGWEKVREQILQQVYQEFGEDYFTSREFKEMYNDRYSQGDWTNWLVRLKGKELKRREISRSRRDNGNVKYEYKLTDKVLDDIEDYGSLISRSHPGFQRKKHLLGME